MKAAQMVAPKTFEFIDVPAPVSKPGEVLIRMEYFSVCGSDLRTYDRTLPESAFPLAPGAPCHEAVGTVEESSDGSIVKGQRVIALQAGGMLEYCSVPASKVVPVPSTGDPALWVLCQPIGTVIYALQRLGSVLGKTVVVLGQGPIGLAFTELLARGGATKVIVSDLHDYRLELAKRFGATHTINATRDDVVEAVTEITGGALADVTVEASGRPETCHQAFEAVRKSGTSIIFGMPHDEEVFSFNWGAMYDKLPTILVTNSARSGDMHDAVSAAVDLATQGRLDLAALLSHRLSWRDVGKAYDMYSRKLDNSLKVVMSVD